MSKKRLFFLGGALLLAFSLLSAVATARSIPERLSQVISQRLNLDREVHRVIETEYEGEKVILIAIVGGEKALDSSLDREITAGLREHMDQTPIAISVLANNKNVRFHPYALRVEQDGQRQSPNRIIGITRDFSGGEMPERVPIEGEVFWGSKGIITLGEGFDLSTPFSIRYGTSSASFSLGDRPVSPDEPKLEREEPEDQRPFVTQEHESPDSTEIQEEPRDTSPPPSESKAEEGLGLLIQLATLLSITLAFL